MPFLTQNSGSEMNAKLLAFTIKYKYDCIIIVSNK